MALATALRSGPARIFRFGPGLVLHLVLNQGQSEASLISVRVCPKHKAVTKPSHCVGARLLRRACHARPTVKYEVVDKLGHRYQITKVGALAFARNITAAVKPSNSDPVRCVSWLQIWLAGWLPRAVYRPVGSGNERRDRLQANLGRAEAQHARVLRHSQEKE